MRSYPSSKAWGLRLQTHARRPAVPAPKDSEAAGGGVSSKLGIADGRVGRSPGVERLGKSDGSQPLIADTRQ